MASSALVACGGGSSDSTSGAGGGSGGGSGCPGNLTEAKNTEWCQATPGNLDCDIVSPAAKQIILPLPSDPALTVFQISRIRSNLDALGATVKSRCNAANTTDANSPLCAGIILYSLTFYRI